MSTMTLTIEADPAHPDDQWPGGDRGGAGRAPALCPQAGRSR
jgi:hypothetical protein